MTTKTTHTPTPWKVAFPSGHIYEPATGFHVATMHPDILGFDARICEANAAHIVRCVNEREPLVDLVRQAYGRWTDNDMVPPNHLLQVWLARAEALLLADARAESEG